ncbi:anhydro-N-acetylmuramic acid kinase [Halopseudomonas yangmingensis]|uniref:Anhydro-N-acetylmuramic acid kinase n=1 Tax=Halopseudomonas yangmingensis TaxID=1720063 RepID=A0A1I4TYU7_9GAMM|nr:anhydro-N-acetylmuramic acid kinase [Halopseudomonas yangmingensis]SFM81912.1 anhydro-N-acetylmuramic acid kinase [Halopseudomonas yangmingensis]
MQPAEQLHIGIMSGTSLDGIDIAVCSFSEPRQVRLLGALYIPMDARLREQLLALCSPGDDELRRSALAGMEWARLVADGIRQVLQQLGIDGSRVSSIGSHGQTVRHHPDLGFSLQIGAPALLAELTGIDVVSDFRSRDLAAGGQGAPLVPAFHQWALSDPLQPICLVNIGGFANLTCLRPGFAVEGFDCGPGNILLDAWIQQHQGIPFDRDGQWAASGHVNQPLLNSMLADPYFSLSGPRSTGREYFNSLWLHRQLAEHGSGIAAVDVQATLLELSARTIANAVHQTGLQRQPVYLCGGGTHNRRLRTRLQALLPEASVSSSAALGIDPDWMEAMAFAWLAWRFSQRLPGNLPEVTGARGSRILGALYPG